MCNVGIAKLADCTRRIASHDAAEQAVIFQSAHVKSRQFVFKGAIDHA
jgi:hypothetical protein